MLIAMRSGGGYNQTPSCRREHSRLNGHTQTGVEYSLVISKMHMEPLVMTVFRSDLHCKAVKELTAIQLAKLNAY